MPFPLKIPFCRFITVLILVSTGSLCTVFSQSKGDVQVKNPSQYFTDPKDAATYYYLEGIKAVNLNDNVQKALECYKKALEVDSLHAPSYYEAGRLSPQGIVYLKRAVELDPDNYWYKQQLLKSYLSRNLLDSALAVCREIIRMQPNNMEAYKDMALIYHHQNSPFAAISLLDSMEFKFGMNPALSEYKKELLIQTRMYDRAIAENKTLVDNFPYNDDYLRSLAELYAMKGADSLAKNAYQKALAIDSTNIQTLTSLSDYYFGKRNYPQFLSTTLLIFKSDELPAGVKVRYFNEVVKKEHIYREHYFQVDQLASTLAIKYPDDPEAAKCYAEHLIYSGRLNDALNVYKACVSDTLKDYEVFTRIMGIEAYLKNPDSVLVYSDMALRAFPRDPDIYASKAGAYYSMEMFPQAIAVLKEAVKYAERDSVKSFLLGFMGDIHHRMGNPKKTFRHYDKALKYDPDNVPVLNNYSYYLSETGKGLEKALAMSARTIEQESGNATYLDTYAWVLYKLGRYKEAKEIIQKAIALDNTNSMELPLHYGDILYELKEYFQASIYWRRALERGYDGEKISERLEKIKGKDKIGGI